MVVEPWMLKMGNQVSGNLKHSLYLESTIRSSTKKQCAVEKQTIGILSFEVANFMSKIIHLHKSLTETEITKLKNDVFKSEGVRTLVCCHERKLLDLALAEKLDDLNRVACAVSRLGKKSTIAALQGFQHVYGDIVSGMIDAKELSFLVKDMDSMIRKMERYVSSTASLYSEMEVMNELEVALKKFQQNNQLEESRKVFEQKLSWQKQDVSHLKDVSLWNQSYDKVVELLARTVCTIYARIHVVFKDAHSGSCGSLRRLKMDSVQKTPALATRNEFQKKVVNSSPEPSFQRFESTSFRPEDFKIACGMGPGRLLIECLSACSSVSKVEYDDCDTESNHNEQTINGDPPTDEYRKQSKQIPANGPNFVTKSSLMEHALPCTVGGSALALHFANVIIVIEKLLQYPHLVGEEARDGLYQMLPNSLRKRLKKTMKSYTKDLAIYDAPVAHEWTERITRILKWLTPLAQNMIKWQSERNFEQQQIVTRTNVLLLQTLYFADREKTEMAICELLVGMNYICRYEQQRNALIDCTSSFGVEEFMEWH